MQRVTFRAHQLVDVNTRSGSQAAVVADKHVKGLRQREETASIVQIVLLALKINSCYKMAAATGRKQQNILVVNPLFPSSETI